MRRRFVRLLRHFFLQFFDVEFGAGEERLGVIAVLGILAVPGALMSLLLFAKYSSLLRWIRREFRFDPDVASLPDKYTFIALSMAVTGIVAVLRWDSLLPDRRDFANLAPLPIDSRHILLTKALALAGFVLLFVVDVNLFSCLFFPSIVMEDHGTASELLRFTLAHAVAVISAGLWTFCGFLALTGILMAVLPYGVFRRSKRYVQFLCVICLLFLFLSASAAGHNAPGLRTGEAGMLAWLPPVWFLGLYQVVQGKAVGSFGELSQIALAALPITLALAIAAYGLSYRFFFLRSAETAEGPATAIRMPEFVRKFDGILFRSGFDRASFRFIFRTLTRSEPHSALLAATLGLGLALAVQSAAGARPGNPVALGVLACPLILIYALLTGLRLSFGMPVDTRANWIFRVSDGESANPGLVAKAAMLLLALPVIAVSSILYAAVFNSAVAFWHAVFSLTASLVFTEALTSDFRVVPFTCSWIPGRGNLVFTAALWLAGLAIFGQGFALMEAIILLDPWRFVPFLLTAAAVLYAIRALREGEQPLAWSDSRGDLDLLRITE